jgi:hypothetical protein
LCADSASKGSRVDVVDERALAVDLDDRQPLPVPRLERRVAGDVDLAEGNARLPKDRPRPLAEVAALGVEEDDVCYG